MSRMMMNDFYQELEKIGVYFEEGDDYAEYVRYGGNDDFGCYGTLGNNKKGDGFSPELWEQILSIAKANDVYFFVGTKYLFLQQYDVCFMRENLFKTLTKAVGPMTDSLKRHFLYYQEDPETLELCTTLERLPEEMNLLQSGISDADSLKDVSAQFRDFVSQRWKLCYDKKYMCAYTDSAFSCLKAIKIYKAIEFLKLSC